MENGNIAAGGHNGASAMDIGGDPGTVVVSGVFPSRPPIPTFVIQNRREAKVVHNH
jgi:hypothetical protein